MSVTLLGNGSAFGTASASVDSSAFSISGTEKYLRVVVLVGDATTQDLPSSVVWDPAGVNESLSLVQESGVFNSFWRGGVYEKVAPSDGASKIVRATWAASREEVLVGASAWSGVHQTTPTRTPPTPGTGSGASPSLAVTSVSGDTVLGHFIFGTPNADSGNRFTSSLMTLREVQDGLDSGVVNEMLAVGDTTASSSSTNVGGSITNSLGSYVWYLFGAALIDAAAGVDPGGGLGGGGVRSRFKSIRPRPFAPGIAR